MSWHAMPHRYCISLKKTKQADKMRESPKLNITNITTGYISIIQFHVMGIPSQRVNTKRIHVLIRKLMREDTLLEKMNIYLGTFTFVKIDELSNSAVIPRFVDSEKYENTICPINK